VTLSDRGGVLYAPDGLSCAQLEEVTRYKTDEHRSLEEFADDLKDGRTFRDGKKGVSRFDGPGAIHQPDEYVNIDSLTETAKVFAWAALQWCGVT